MIARILLLVLLGFALPAVAQAPQSDWIEDATTGCRVWNPRPEPNETIRWTGPCIEGIANGTGVLEWFKDGQPNGRTEGEYREGKQNGPATVTRPNGTTIVGTFFDDKISGQGTVTWPSGDKLVAEFRDGKLDGTGTLTWVNGDRYAGEFRGGKRTGHGTYTRHDGLSYDGDFVDGRFEGQGTLTLPNGDKFVGEFRNGKQTTNGTFTRRAQALCRGAEACEAFAKVRQECAVAGDYDLCVKIKMGDRDYSTCAPGGGFTGGTPKDMPNWLECALYSLVN